MPYGLYISAEGAHAQSKRLEVVANNLANVDTVGFKRELAIFQARYAEETQQGNDDPSSGSINNVGGGILVRETKTDFSGGPLKRTQVNTDLAIDGDGFFVVEKGGEKFLTRAGNFRLTERGELVTQQGYPVLTETGSPIVIDRNNGPWEMSPTGVIRQGNTIQTVAIVVPKSSDDLTKAGENLFRTAGDPDPVAAGQRKVASGYLEQSQVRPTMEMMDLIEASRGVEMNLNMMQTQDQMLSSLISRVLRV